MIEVELFPPLATGGSNLNQSNIACRIAFSIMPARKLIPINAVWPF